MHLTFASSAQAGEIQAESPAAMLSSLTIRAEFFPVRDAQPSAGDQKQRLPFHARSRRLVRSRFNA
jgi:hypothetical protein